MRASIPVGDEPSHLGSWGHEDIIDMGGIAASRGLEAWLLMWTRLYGVLGTPMFNLKVLRPS